MDSLMGLGRAADKTRKAVVVVMVVVVKVVGGGGLPPPFLFAPWGAGEKGGGLLFLNCKCRRKL